MSIARNDLCKMSIEELIYLFNDSRSKSIASLETVILCTKDLTETYDIDPIDAANVIRFAQDAQNSLDRSISLNSFDFLCRKSSSHGILSVSLDRAYESHNYATKVWRVLQKKWKDIPKY